MTITTGAGLEPGTKVLLTGASWANVTDDTEAVINERDLWWDATPPEPSITVSRGDTYFIFEEEDWDWTVTIVDAPGDEVNPSHYKRSVGVLGVEVVDILDFFFPDNPHLWNAGKYLLRAGYKPSADKKTDLEKLMWYVNREIEKEGAES